MPRCCHAICLSVLPRCATLQAAQRSGRPGPSAKLAEQASAALEQTTDRAYRALVGGQVRLASGCQVFACVLVHLHLLKAKHSKRGQQTSAWGRAAWVLCGRGRAMQAAPLSSRPAPPSHARCARLDAAQRDLAGMQEQLTGLLDCLHLRTQLLLRWGAQGEVGGRGLARMRWAGRGAQHVVSGQPTREGCKPPAAAPPWQAWLSACPPLPASMQRAAVPLPRAPAQRADGPSAARGAAAAVAAGVAPHAGWARGPLAGRWAGCGEGEAHRARFSAAGRPACCQSWPTAPAQRLGWPPPMLAPAK